jgi:LDH2 family malate/lactate/ureidoglycolate dehydrogenase
MAGCWPTDHYPDCLRGLAKEHRGTGKRQQIRPVNHCIALDPSSHGTTAFKQVFMKQIQLPLDELEDLVHRALLNLGLEKSEATIVTDVLMYAEKRGSSQGLIKLRERTVIPDTDCKPVRTTNKTRAVVSLDGGGHTGMFVLQQATDTARVAVADFGITLVTTSNTRSSTGALAYYARQLADNGFIAMVLAGSPKVMAVEGGIDPVLGTNPIAIGIPATGNSIVFDGATAAVTWFSVLAARDNHEPLPPGAAIDAQGLPTQDPTAAMGGALRTIAGAKGSGLALMFEFLTASLADTSIVGDSRDNRANTIICIDPAQVLDGDRFYLNADRLAHRIKMGRAAAGSESVRLPGESSEARAAQCEAHNSIVVEAGLLDEVKRLAACD